MAKSFIKTRIRLPKVPSVPQKYSAKLILPTARAEGSQCCPGRAVWTPLCSLTACSEGKLGHPAHPEWGTLPPSRGFCFPRAQGAAHRPGTFPLGTPWTTQLPSRPPRGAGSNPTFSQKSLTGSGTAAEPQLVLCWGHPALPCPLLLSQGTLPQTHPPSSQGSFSRGVRDAQATLPSLWLWFCGAQVCAVQGLLPHCSS